MLYIKKIIDIDVFNFFGKIAPNNDSFIYYYGFPMKTLKYIFNFVGVFTSLYNILLEYTSKIIKM